MLEIPHPVLSTDQPNYSLGERAVLLCVVADVNGWVDRMLLIGPQRQVLNESWGDPSVSATIAEVASSDYGEHVCIAQSRAGSNTTSVVIKERGTYIYMCTLITNSKMAL